MGAALAVRGSAPELTMHLRAWARSQGHAFEETEGRATLVRGSAQVGRWRGAEATGTTAPRRGRV